MVTHHIARVWINRVWLPILLVVSWTGKLIFPCPRSRLRIWPRTGSTLPSRVSLLIFILRLNMVLTYGIPPEFCGSIHYLKSVSTIAPPPNRRLHEPENKEYSPLQAAKLKNKMRDRLVFTITSTCEQIGSALKIIRLEKRRGIGFETVAGMGGGYHRRNTIYRHTPPRQSRVDRVTQLRTDGVHCREFAGTGPVNLKVVPNGCCLGRSPWTN